ncbi:MAG: primosomal protein [Mycobacteriaceae bacterium]|nr:primosomal protein [Mycobacteriaceae bacterium]
MAADIVPIRLELTDGDLYTLWAPRWRDAGDEWEAFLGKDEELYGFESVAELVAFVRTNTDNDLADHPSWKTLTAASARELDPAQDRRYDLIGVPDLLAEKPTEESVKAVHGAVTIAASIGSVCELAAVTKFFNGNPNLGGVSAGLEYFTGKAGLKRWHEIGTIIGKGWDNVIDAIDDIITTPDVDKEVAEQAEAELLTDDDDVLEGADGELDESDDSEDSEPDERDEALEPDDDEEEEAEAGTHDESVVLGSDEDFWIKVGIDPVRLLTSSGTFYTLRCYLDDEPIFLGRNGRVSVFGSGGALARYLADEHDHDLSDLATYDDIRTAATDGSLRIDVSDDNVYVLTGLADDLADGPDALDRDQLELAVELLRDVGEYSEDDTVDELLDVDRPLGRLVAHVLDPDTVRKPNPPYVKAVEEWEALESFLDSRLRRE